MADDTQLAVADTLLAPLRWIAVILALPINFVASITEIVRKRRYNPEKVVCPGCGFKGDNGTDNKTCRIAHTLTGGPEKAVNEHTCFRCGALYYTSLFLPAEKWLAKQPINDKIVRAAQRTVL